MIKLAHYGLSTCFIEVTTSTIMKTVMKWVIIVVIIVSTIDTALVDSVCICHLRKRRPPIRLLSSDTLPIDSSPIWAALFQDNQRSLFFFASKENFCSAEQIFEGKTRIGDLGGLLQHTTFCLLALTPLSWPRALHQVVACLTPTDGCLEPCQAARGGPM